MRFGGCEAGLREACSASLSFRTYIIENCSRALQSPPWVVQVLVGSRIRIRLFPGRRAEREHENSSRALQSPLLVVLSLGLIFIALIISNFQEREEFVGA